MSNKLSDEMKQAVLEKSTIDVFDLFKKNASLFSNNIEEKNDIVCRMLFSVVLVVITDCQMATDKAIRNNLKNFIDELSNFSEDFIRMRRSKIKDMV